MGDRILLIEDDIPYRVTLRSILEEAGYEVLEASYLMNGKLKVKQADIIILDLRLPDSPVPLSTFSAFIGLSVPILVHTGADDDEVMRLLKESGMVSIVRKPSSIKRILGEIGRLLMESKVLSFREKKRSAKVAQIKELLGSLTPEDISEVSGLFK